MRCKISDQKIVLLQKLSVILTRNISAELERAAVIPTRTEGVIDDERQSVIMCDLEHERVMQTKGITPLNNILLQELGYR